MAEALAAGGALPMAPPRYSLEEAASYDRSKDKAGSGFFGRFSALRGPRGAPEAKGTDPFRKIVQVVQRISSGDQI